MSNNSKSSIVFAAAILSLMSLVAVFTVSGQSSRGKEKDADTQWEYLVVAGAGNVNLSGTSDLGRKQPDNSFAEATVLERNLDKLGQKGWELVAVQAVQGMPNQPMYYLKRQKESR